MSKVQDFGDFHFLNLRGDIVPILIGAEEEENPWLVFFHEVESALESDLESSEKIKEIQMALTCIETESQKEDWLIPR